MSFPFLLIQTIVIGKTGKDIPKEKALEYIAGYVAGDDVSARKWQRDPAYAGGVPQWCFSKGFDRYAPLGPCIVSQKVIGDAGKLQLQTRVNGDIRQDTNTDDLIFGIPELISFLSQGTTLQKGSLIMTGTPSGIHFVSLFTIGVAMGMNPPMWLKDGDTVEVSIEKIGTLKHTIKFE
jgi:2-keto-4-pentenoate hydratase/2-oxohepta-3-ene-1,7-dioic acid hydratase in catechol pathway